MNEWTATGTEAGMYVMWDEKFATGVEIVDTQHRGLIHILNGLYKSIGEGRGDAVLRGIFGELQRYADYHFDTEERLLKLHAVTPHHQAEHVIRHMAYRRRIEDLKVRHEDGERLIPIQVLAFVCDWWLDHILTCDRIFVSLVGDVHGMNTEAVVENVQWPSR